MRLRELAQEEESWNQFIETSVEKYAFDENPPNWVDVDEGEEGDEVEPIPVDVGGEWGVMGESG